jgi:hypothetical protein
MTPPDAASRRSWALALSLALILSVLYAIPDLRTAFSGPYVAQNDARQHVFWMQRFNDPQLFPDDWIADYYQTIAPWGYDVLYRAFGWLGVEPLLACKLVGLPIAVAAAGYAFALGARVLATPTAALLSSALLSQANWSTSDLASGTPHGFATLLFVAFLYHLSRRSEIPVVATLALQGLFYPHILFVSCGTLVLWLVRFEDGRLRVRRERKDLAFVAWGVIAALIVTIPFMLSTARYGPTVTVEQARRMPEFLRGGRASFFYDSFYPFWFTNIRSGVLANFFAASFMFEPASIPMLSGLLLPALRRWPERFPAAARVTAAGGLLWRGALSGVGLFCLAHAMLFRLHLPSRYSMFSLRVVLAIAGGVCCAILFDAARRALATRARGLRAAALLALGLAATAFLVAPVLRGPAGHYIIGPYPEVYRFFANQPAGTQIASLSLESDNVPTFSGRSVLVSRLGAVPYQLGYYLPLRRGALDLLSAEYAEDPAELAAFVRRYRPDFFLVESDAFTKKWVKEAWIYQFHPLSDAIVERLVRGSVPALARMLESCGVLHEKNLVVLPADCVAGWQPTPS